MNLVTDAHQPYLKFWGEENQDGVTYSIFLKKVCYRPKDSKPEETHLEWETVRVRVLKAGTLEKLVESLATDTGEIESTYVNIFLSTYRSFATTQQVLTLLLDRYAHLCEEKTDTGDDTRELHKTTLFKVLLVWIDVFPEDFFTPPQFLLLHQLLEFTKKYVLGDALQLRAKHVLEKFQNNGTKDMNGFPSMPSPTTISSSPNSSDALRLTFLEINNKHFAQQLTYIDSLLFKKLVPHHCLGSVWSQREKLRNWSFLPSTVTATVNQFNAVSFRVLSTILSDPSLKPYLRAEIISKWIAISQELRFQKNFSSLKAVTAALQCNPIYRLKSVWVFIPNDTIETFSELAEIFSEDNNQLNCRNLLMKEGSAKFANTVGAKDKQLQKALHKQTSQNSGVMQGTIPYLGTFLTDLTMIDTAILDFLPNGLINFDKRRREFEVLAQIKLLQSSANNYSITPDNNFKDWFISIPILEDNESYELSCLIEPLEPNSYEKKTEFQKYKSPMTKWGHQKNDSTSSTSSSNSQFYDQISCDSNCSLTAQDAYSDKSSKMGFSVPLPFFLSSNQIPSDTRSPSQEFYVIKVSLEQNSEDGNGVNLYKSIILSNEDRTKTVISNALMKHGVTGDPNDYILSQLVPGGEIVFPSSANVFYAVNTTYDLNFILRIRQDNEENTIKKNKAHFVKRFLHSTT